MVKQVQGVIHGKTIELDQDPGIAEGLRVGEGLARHVCPGSIGGLGIRGPRGLKLPIFPSRECVAERLPAHRRGP